MVSKQAVKPTTTKVVDASAPSGTRFGGTNPAGSGHTVQPHKVHTKKGY